MKKLTLILISCFSILFFACNKDLKNSEAFVGDYTSEGYIKSTLTYTLIGEIETSTDIDEIFTNKTFSIALGEYDDEVIISVPEYNIDVVAKVTENKIDVAPTQINIFLSDYGMLTIPVTISGKGTLVDAELSYDLKISGEQTNALFAFAIEATVSGKAIKD
ncbi:hypothetical protein LJC69_04720 [Bacteroidales bacterium OttesenSCG-928-K22]|nr:hypothetical protein [Bacteroidales bacterium OttesenSCG-928-L14]MDL2240909.1 hypothetical protein [Bacteroidales bacterium OttesenSCG-928-K22]